MKMSNYHIFLARTNDFGQQNFILLNVVGIRVRSKLGKVFYKWKHRFLLLQFQTYTLICLHSQYNLIHVKHLEYQTYGFLLLTMMLISHTK